MLKWLIKAIIFLKHTIIAVIPEFRSADIPLLSALSQLPDHNEPGVTCHKQFADSDLPGGSSLYGSNFR
jgi:hypothetical protein